MTLPDLSLNSSKVPLLVEVSGMRNSRRGNWEAPTANFLDALKIPHLVKHLAQIAEIGGVVVPLPNSPAILLLHQVQHVGLVFDRNLGDIVDRELPEQLLAGGGVRRLPAFGVLLCIRPGPRPQR